MNKWSCNPNRFGNESGRATAADCSRATCLQLGDSVPIQVASFFGNTEFTIVLSSSRHPQRLFAQAAAFMR
jgi:hypothetical protein